MHPLRRTFLFGVILLAVAAGACTPPAPAPRGDGVSLVVLIVVDQARHDYLERFRPLLDGGLGRLLDEGTVFTDAHHDHAETSTAPGHATLATGVEPARSGIVGNDWYDRESDRLVLAAGTPGNASPGSLEVTALGDWMRARDGRSKVFAASPKERSAVMLGGQDPDGVYWYDRWTGEWRTGTYYRRGQRQWLEELNLRRPLDRLFGTLWTPSRPEAATAELGIQELDRGVFERGFPHAVGGSELEPGPQFYNAVYSTPYVDWYLGRLAETILVEEELGMDGSVDLLGLGFSALDSVGHDYGPHSREVLDVILRLDGLLDAFLDLLEARVGREHVLVALSSDHGIPPLPELLRLAGERAGRLGGEDIACIQNAGRTLRERVGGRDWLLSSRGGFYLDGRVLESLGTDRATVERTAAELLEECSAVRRVWTSTELASGEPVDDPYWARYRNNFYPGRSPDLQVQLQPYYLLSGGTGTTHGSPYDYDSQVPLILWGAGIEPGRVEDRASTADLAPTIAALLGVPIPEGVLLDGVDRSRAIAAAGAPDVVDR